MKRTKLEANRYRYDSKNGFGAIEFQGAIHATGTDWYARIAFYQKKPSRGFKIKLAQDQRMPRWKKIGHFETLEKAEEAMRNALRSSTPALAPAPDQLKKETTL